MYERFTGDVRRAVALAEEEARQLGHTEVRPEHLLIGLLADRNGPGAVALFELGLSLDAVRDAVRAETDETKQTKQTNEPDETNETDQTIEPDETDAMGSERHASLPFDPAAKSVLEEGLRLAVRSSSDTVESSHLLLAVLAETDSLGSELLSRAAGGREVARQAISGSADPLRFAVSDLLTTTRPSPRWCPHPPLVLIAEPATIDGPGSPVEVTIVRCRQCQRTVGVLPGPGGEPR